MGSLLLSITSPMVLFGYLSSSQHRRVTSPRPSNSYNNTNNHDTSIALAHISRADLIYSSARTLVPYLICMETTPFSSRYHSGKICCLRRELPSSLNPNHRHRHHLPNIP